MNRTALWFWVWTALAVTVALPLAGPFGGLRGHDQQRIGQVAVLVIASFGVAGFLARNAALVRPGGRLAKFGIPAFFMLGLWSAGLSRYPVWALTEVSLFTASLALAWLVAQLRAENPGASLDRCLGFTLLFLCTAFSARFVVSYVSLITSGFGRLDTRLMLSGFTNVRFFGQFQALTVSLIVWPILGFRLYPGKTLGLCVLGVLWWIQVFAGGSRGLWLGLLAAGVILPATGRPGRLWAILQGSMAAAGLAGYWVLFTLIPKWLNMAVSHHAAERLTVSLSGRAALWQRAAGLAAQRPLLGVGPMHFADSEIPMSAHPHQAALQLAAEWGVPAALLAALLLLAGAIRLFRILRARSAANSPEDALRVCLAAALLSAAALAMVDGVIVMPYTQLWLAIMGGWLTGVCVTVPRPRSPARPWRWICGVTAMSAVAVLLFVVARDAPLLQRRIEDYRRAQGGAALRPRFWNQGLIADTPEESAPFSDRATPRSPAGVSVTGSGDSS